MDKRKGLSPDYLFVIKSGWTEQMLDEQNKEAFPKSYLCSKIKMAIFYAEYILNGQNNWAFPKSIIVFVQKSR